MAGWFTCVSPSPQPRGRGEAGLIPLSAPRRGYHWLVLLPQKNRGCKCPEYCRPSSPALEKRGAVTGLIPPPFLGGWCVCVIVLFLLCFTLAWRGVGAVGLVTNPPGRSEPVGLKWPYGPIHALEGLIHGSADFAVFVSMLETGKGRSLEIMGVPPYPATPTFWNQCLPELAPCESIGKLPSCGVALFWHRVLTVLLFSWWFPEV